MGNPEVIHVIKRFFRELRITILIRIRSFIKKHCKIKRSNTKLCDFAATQKKLLVWRLYIREIRQVMVGGGGSFNLHVYSRQFNLNNFISFTYENELNWIRS